MSAVSGRSRQQKPSRREKSPRLSKKESKRLFELPRRLNDGVRKCGCQVLREGETQQDLVYLWASFKVADEGGLSVDGWLNVVDEAASLGLNFIVFSLDSPLSENPGIWPVCHWAQETYGITVGIHTDGKTITPQDIEEFKRLDLSKARLYVLREDVERVSGMAGAGVKVGAADPRGDGRANPQPCCDLPNRMLFVNQQGVMYTCKYVDNDDKFRLAHVKEQPFKNLVKDPTLPRTVPGSVPYVSHGCDGCPPILCEEEQS